MRPSRSTSAQQWALIAIGAIAFTVLSIPAATAQSTDGVCDDLLLQVSPNSISGDQSAVAITSQQLEADVPGWVQVSWEAAADTTLTGVTVRTEAQTFTLTDDIASGTVEDALELTFCGSTAVTAPDTDSADGADDDAGDTQVTQPVEEVCDNVLIAISPDSVSGDETAVAITAQQLDADAVGWVSVSWEAAADTTLTGVTVRTVSGTATLIDDLRTGTVEDALELTFCGTVASDDGGDPDDGSDDEPTEVPEVDGGSGGSAGTGGGTTSGGTTSGGGSSTGGSSTGGSSTGGSSTGGSSTGGTGGGGTSGGATVPAPSDDDGAVPEPEPAPEPDSEPEPEEPAEEPIGDTDGDDASDTDDGAAEDDGTEVLGVQLSQDDDGSGWLMPVLLILLTAGAIGAGVLVRNRYLATSGGQS